MAPGSGDNPRIVLSSASGLPEVELRFDSTRQFAEQYADFLSRDGVFICTDQPQAPSTVLRFRVRLPGDFILVEGNGVVEWVRSPEAEDAAPAGMAVRFISLAGQSKEVIEQIVARHQQQTGRSFSLDSPLEDQLAAVPAGHAPVDGNRAAMYDPTQPPRRQMKLMVRGSALPGDQTGPQPPPRATPQPAADPHSLAPPPATPAQQGKQLSLELDEDSESSWTGPESVTRTIDPAALEAEAAARDAAGSGLPDIDLGDAGEYQWHGEQQPEHPPAGAGSGTEAGSSDLDHNLAGGLGSLPAADLYAETDTFDDDVAQRAAGPSATASEPPAEAPWDDGTAHDADLGDQHVLDNGSGGEAYQLGEDPANGLGTEDGSWSSANEAACTAGETVEPTFAPQFPDETGPISYAQHQLAGGRSAGDQIDAAAAQGAVAEQGLPSAHAMEQADQGGAGPADDGALGSFEPAGATGPEMAFEPVGTFEPAGSFDSGTPLDASGPSDAELPFSGDGPPSLPSLEMDDEIGGSGAAGYPAAAGGSRLGSSDSAPGDDPPGTPGLSGTGGEPDAPAAPLTDRMIDDPMSNQTPYKPSPPMNSPFAGSNDRSSSAGSRQELPELAMALSDPPSSGRPPGQRSLESILGPDLADGTDSTRRLEGISPDNTLGFDDLTSDDRRPSKRRIPIWLLAALLLAVLGAAGYFARDTILPLLPFGNEAAPQVAEAPEAAAQPFGAEPPEMGQGSTHAMPAGSDEGPAGTDQAQQGPAETASAEPGAPTGSGSDTAPGGREGDGSGSVQGFGPATGAAGSVREPEPASASTFGRLSRILDITWDREAAGTAITLTGDGAFTDDVFNVLPLTDPPRILVRLNRIEEKYAEHEIAVGTAEVRSIRIGHHPENRPPQLFVVLDLTDDLASVTDTRATGRQLRITVSR